jgi:hypothetical protein
MAPIRENLRDIGRDPVNEIPWFYGVLNTA